MGHYITFWKTKLHFSLTKIHYSHAVPLALRSWFSFSSENVARIPSSVPRQSTVKFSLYDGFPRQPLSALEDHKNHWVGTAMYVYGCEQLLKDEIPPCNPPFCSFTRSISCSASHLCSFLLPPWCSFPFQACSSSILALVLQPSLHLLYFPHHLFSSLGSQLCSQQLIPASHLRIQTSEWMHFNFPLLGSKEMNSWWWS